MLVEKVHNANYLLITFGAARLDPANCAVLQRELAAEFEGEPQDMVIDMSEVAYAVSPAVNVILDTHERCRANGRQMILVGLRSPVRRILSLSGLISVLAPA